jgi:23S rRNA pseudouridine1911/1915/1917 synthase
LRFSSSFLHPVFAPRQESYNLQWRYFETQQGYSEKVEQTRMKTRQASVSAAEAGWRCDRVLSAKVEQLNRRAAKLLFRNRLVRLNGKVASGAERVNTGDMIEFPDPESAKSSEVIERAKAPRLTTAHGRHLIRIFEDDEILVINKPAEIPVHRGENGYTRRDTLEQVLDKAYPPTGNGPPGSQGYYFVHRLDMETSGCLLIAKNDHMRDALLEQFSERKVHKQYIAIVVGEVEWKKLIVKNPIDYVRVEDEPETPNARTRRWERRKPPMRGLKKGVALDEGDPRGKEAETRFDVLARYNGFTVLRCEPKTGRTHQLRVHLTHIGHPLAYDPLYGRLSPIRFREFDPHSGETDAGDEVVLNRLPLHAWKVGITHPDNGQFLAFEAPLPRDLKEFLRLLKKYRAVKK